MALDKGHRGWRLAVGVLVGSGLVVVPVLVAGPDHLSNAVLAGGALACAILIGVGRQGIDVLILRLVAAGIVVSFGWVFGGAIVQSSSICPALYECDVITLDLVLLGLVIAAFLSFGAIPTWIVWTRGFSGLHLEIAWRRLLVPRTWWHWVVMFGVLGVFLTSCVLAFPTPA
jgi:hypothetical protein